MRQIMTNSSCLEGIYQEEWVLVIRNDTNIDVFPWEKRQAWERFVYTLSDISKIYRIFSKRKKCLLVIAFRNCLEDISDLKNIRSLTEAPIIVFAQKYNGEEKISTIDAGADEYIEYPETIWEAVASCRALIRRFTVYNKESSKSKRLILQGEVCIDKDSRRIFINGIEFLLARREYGLFCLLASCPGRVFTYEQLFHRLWEDSDIPTENSVHSCIRRIRRKLESIPDCPCRIENMRGVGYFFRQIEP